MLYLIGFFFIVTVILTYRNLNSFSTRFLYGIILGWIISLVSLILYLNTNNYYYNTINNFFPFTRGTWSTLASLNLDPDMLIRMLTMGVVLFNYSVLGFAIAFTSRKQPRFKKMSVYLLLMIFPLLQILFYDPAVYKLLDSAFKALFVSGPGIYNLIAGLFYNLSRLLNFLYLLSAFYIFLKYYRKHPNIRFLRNYTLFSLLCLSPIVIIHFLIFSWAPKMLIRSTMITGYYYYSIPDISEYVLLFNILPYIVMLSLAVMVYSIYRYNSVEAYYNKCNVHISRSIDTAALGVRAFTHAMKNHLLAIRSEAEFLKEKYKDDSETLYSLKLIFNSCDKSFNSIETAAQRLKNIKLNLEPTELSIPVEKAVSRFIPVKSDINLKVYYPEEIPISYIDTNQFSEALYNIIDNAVESINSKSSHMPSSQPVIKIIVEARNNWAILMVSDTGCGIAEEDMKRIFDPFFTTKSSISNWGIGLSYCHKIINAHDGKISVESRLGEGTTIKIALPIV